MIRDFIRFVDTGDYTVLDRYPAYLGSQWPRFSDRVAVGLGIFGPRAPALNYGGPNDRAFSLTQGDPDTNLEMVGEHRRLQYLPFKLVPIMTAKEYFDSAFRSGIIRIPHPRHNVTEFTNSKAVALRVVDPEFLPMYNAIKSISQGRIAALANTLPKRKRGGDDDSGERKKKISRSDAAMAF